MKLDWRRNNSLTNFFYSCSTCELNSQISIEDFLEYKLQKILGIKAEKLEEGIKKGNIQFFHSFGIPTLQFRKDVGHIESGTVVYLSDKIEVIRGFPKIRRTLLLSPTVEMYFNDQVAVEEKMNGYNVRVACIGGLSDSTENSNFYSSFSDDAMTPEKLEKGEDVADTETLKTSEDFKIIALTRGGYICPFTTKKAQELMDLSKFFYDNPEMVICGEMVGTANPYVSQYYPEIGKLGFRVFDIRHKLTNHPLTVEAKHNLLKEYGLPPVTLFGIFPAEGAVPKLKEIIKQIGSEGREGLVMKDPQMEIPPLKYTSSQAHDREVKYAFQYPFDFGRAFFFSRVIREGFQAYEMQESPEEVRQRAQRMGESIILPMIEMIQQIAQGESAMEDAVIEVHSKEEAEEFVRHLHDLGVTATLVDYQDGQATIRRTYNSTTDKTRNYLNGGLY
jgi:putative ATP-dependent DNA ligase